MQRPSKHLDSSHVDAVIAVCTRRKNFKSSMKYITITVSRYFIDWYVNAVMTVLTTVMLLAMLNVASKPCTCVIHV